MDLENVIPTLLALFAVGLIGAALVLMAGENLAVAGVCFLSASIVIFLRARWIQRHRSGAG
jgi:uncharacterized membrane protein YjjP (DUF1212 family)